MHPHDQQALLDSHEQVYDGKHNDKQHDNFSSSPNVRHSRLISSYSSSSWWFIGSGGCWSFSDCDSVGDSDCFSTEETTQGKRY